MIAQTEDKSEDLSEEPEEKIAVIGKPPAINYSTTPTYIVLKAVFFVLGALGLATMWKAVFVDVGVALAAIANATKVLK